MLTMKQWYKYSGEKNYQFVTSFSKPISDFVYISKFSNKELKFDYKHKEPSKVRLITIFLHNIKSNKDCNDYKINE